MDGVEAVKMCVICGEDCSAVARVRDGQGNYACRSCVEAKRAKRAAQRAAGRSSAPAIRAHPRPVSVLAPDIIPLADDGADHAAVLDDLPASPEPTGGPCPNCGMPTKAGAVICMGCGFNLATGVEAGSTKLKERRVREPIAAPTSARLAAGAGLSCAGGGIGLAVWAALAFATGEPWYAMASLVGVLAGVGMLLAVRGGGQMITGWIALGPGLTFALAGMVLFSPAPTEAFPNPFAMMGMGQLFSGADVSMVLVMGEDEAVYSGLVWLVIAGLAAFAFGRSNPDDEEAADAAQGGSA